MESLQKEIEVNNLTYDFIITNNGGVIFDKKWEFAGMSLYGF